MNGQLYQTVLQSSGQTEGEEGARVYDKRMINVKVCPLQADMMQCVQGRGGRGVHSDSELEGARTS